MYAPARLALGVHEDALGVLDKAVLHEPIEHPARLDREDEFRVRFDELHFLLLDVVGDRVARVPDVVAAVDALPISVPRDLLQGQVPNHAGPALFRSELEVLPEQLRDDLEVFRHSVERVDRLVRQRRGGFRLLTHLRATPPFRRSRSRPLPPPPRAALPPLPRTPRNSVPSRRGGVPRRSRGPG